MNKVLPAFILLHQQVRHAFGQDRTYEKSQQIALAATATVGRHTITGIIQTAGRSDKDWSAYYRIFEQNRISMPQCWDTILQQAISLTPENMPFVVAMDDTITPRKGTKGHGVSLRRDPQGPKYRPNFIPGQRWVQLSALVPFNGYHSRVTAVPINMLHAPTPKKPGPKATDEQRSQYKADQKACRVTTVGAEALKELRARMDEDPNSRHRRLVLTVDGGYMNKTILTKIPKNTTIIGRIRYDARLTKLPDKQPKTGKPRVYGDPIPKPDLIRQDDSYEWEHICVYSSGKFHVVRIKTVDRVRWKGVGAQDFRLVVVAPTPYRLKKNGRTLYRNPAYILCSDPDMPVEQVVQLYIWRWEQEVAFREEKSYFGIGDPQVWCVNSVCNVIPFLVWVYSLMHLAAIISGVKDEELPRPKWQRRTIDGRLSTNRLAMFMRQEVIDAPHDREYGEVVARLQASIHPMSDSITRRHQNSDIHQYPAWLYAMK